MWETRTAIQIISSVHRGPAHASPKQYNLVSMDGFATLKQCTLFRINSHPVGLSAGTVRGRPKPYGILIYLFFMQIILGP